MLEQQQCDPNTVHRFLADALDDHQIAAFEHHLGLCDHCRQQLTATAAQDALWVEVQESLGTHPWTDTPGWQRDKTQLGRRQHWADPQYGAGPEFEEEADATTDIALSLLKPTDEPNMLGRFGGYEIAGVIGRGGMGIVFKAFDRSLHRYVAIKALSPHFAASGAARKRFSREAQAAAAVVHDNVIAIHSVAQDNGHPYLVMPYERGCSLQKRLDDNGPLNVIEILRIGMQASAGLAAAHAQGLVHRDVKPANILLAEGVERIKLTDFGLARAADDASLTRTGLIAGTPQYMSPEQARGEQIDQRSDLFSLGSVLYIMCTGRLPFRAETSYGILRQVTDSQPTPIRELNPEIPDWLCQIVDKLLSKSPQDRYQTAAGVSELLGQCLSHRQQPNQHPLPTSLRRSTTSNWLSLKLGLTCLAVLLSASLIALALVASDGFGLFSQPQTAAITSAPSEEAVELNEADLGWNAIDSQLSELDQNTRSFEVDSLAAFQDQNASHRPAERQAAPDEPAEGRENDSPEAAAKPVEQDSDQDASRLAEITVVLQNFIRDQTKREQRLQAFVEKEAKSDPQKVSGLEELSRVKLELARLQLKLARTQPDEQKSAALLKARNTFEDAQKYNDRQLENWVKAAITRESRKQSELSGDEAKAHATQLAKMRADYLKLQLVSATCLEESADACDTTKSAEELLNRAVAAYEDVYQKYRTRVAGIHSRLSQARCLNKLTKNKEALSICEELLALPDSPRVLRALKTKTQLLAVQCWLVGTKADIATAARRGEEWLKTQTKVDPNNADWKELSELVAKAQQMLKQQEPQSQP